MKAEPLRVRPWRFAGDVRALDVLTCTLIGPSVGVGVGVIVGVGVTVIVGVGVGVRVTVGVALIVGLELMGDEPDVLAEPLTLEPPKDAMYAAADNGKRPLSMAWSPSLARRSK